MSEAVDSKEKYLRMAAALILSKRYRTIGAPSSTVLSILKKTGLSISDALKELENRLNSVGVLLKRIKTRHGSRVSDRFLAVIDPTIELDELRPYDDVTLSVLAILFIKHTTSGKISVSSVLDDLASILNDRDKAQLFLKKGLTRLINDKVIRINDSGEEISFTEIGKAMLPPPELIDEMLIDALLEERTDE